MAKDTKKRPFYYRRAKWDGQKEDKTLQAILEECHDNMPTVGERTFQSGEGELRGADAERKAGVGFFLHIASYVPDERATTIDKARTSRRSNLYTETAADGREFLNGDIFILIKDNHLILCPSGVRESIAFSYINLVLKKCGFALMLASFQLEKIAKASKMALIAKEGVKAIELNASLYEASVLEIDESEKKNNRSKIDELVKKASELIEDMFSQDPELSEIRENENLDIKLSLSFDGREARRKGKPEGFGELGRSRLKKASEQIIQDLEKPSDELHFGDEDGFKIITGSGNVITPTEIRVSDAFYVKTFGKTLDKQDAFDKLEDYLGRLKISGVLVQ